MRLIVGGGRRPRLRFWTRLVRKAKVFWRQMFEPAPDGPGTPPPLAKAEALRQGALLSEFTDAWSRIRAA